MNNESYNLTKFNPYEYQKEITVIVTEEQDPQIIKDPEKQAELPKFCDFKLKDITHFDVIF